LWFKAQLAGSRSSRKKRKLIVALVRRLLVALRRHVATGVVPAGAQLKG